MTDPVTAEMSTALPGERRPITTRSARSRVSNGNDVLPGIDGRSQIARRYRDIADAIVSDQGGLDHCSESRLQLIRRFAAAAVLAEQTESRLANGEEIDIAQHALLVSSLVRIANKIGIDRTARDVTPTLGDILRKDNFSRMEADDAAPDRASQ